MQNSTLTLLSMGVVVLICIPLAVLAKDVLPRVIVRASGIEGVEIQLYQLQTEAHTLQRAVQSLTADRNRLSLERSRLHSEIRKLEKAARDSSNLHPDFVHEIGEPQRGLTRFSARLVQENPTIQTGQNGERVEPNPIWRFENLLEIWASSHEEARAVAEAAYPVKLGYLKQFLNPPGKPMRVARVARADR